MQFQVVEWGVFARSAAICRFGVRICAWIASASHKTAGIENGRRRRPIQLIIVKKSLTYGQ
jgi:hypothetical protein